MRFPIVFTRNIHNTQLNLSRGPLVFPGWYPRDHKPDAYPKNEEERRQAAIKYGLRPEDYKPYNRDDVVRYAGNYPDLGVVTFDHKDPYAAYTDNSFNRNWGEPVQKDFLYYHPARLTFTGLDAEKIKPYAVFVSVLSFFVPLYLFFLYIRDSNPDRFRWKNPAMPKELPYDFYRSFPMNNPRNFPITHYSFEPMDE